MYARASGGLPGHRHSAPGVLLCWDLPTLDPRCRVGPLSGATTLCLERQPQRILCFQPQAHGGAAGRRWATPGVCLKMEPPSRPQLLQNQLKIIQLHDPTRREHDFFTLASLSMRDGTQLAEIATQPERGLLQNIRSLCVGQAGTRFGVRIGCPLCLRNIHERRALEAAAPVEVSGGERS